MRRREVVVAVGTGLASLTGCLGRRNEATGVVVRKSVIASPRPRSRDDVVLVTYSDWEDGQMSFGRIVGSQRERDRLRTLLPAGPPVKISADVDETLRSRYPDLAYCVYLGIHAPTDTDGGGDGDFDACYFFADQGTFNEARLGARVAVELTSERGTGFGCRDGEILINGNLDTIERIRTVTASESP